MLFFSNLPKNGSTQSSIQESQSLYIPAAIAPIIAAPAAPDSFLFDVLIETLQEASDERREEIRDKLGINDPIYIQFFNFVGNSAQGNFGISYQLKRPVSVLIAERMPATLELVFVSALLAIISGVILGVYTGINRDTFFSNVILVISLAGVSLPTFIIGIMLIYLFSVILGVLPSFGRGEVIDIGFWSTGFLTLSGLKALILPSVTLSLFQMTYVIRLVRAEMMEILQTDYIKFAKARGIKKNIINYNAILMSMPPLAKWD